MKRKPTPIREYFSAELNCIVKVYPDKPVKRIPWQRGESYLGAKLRIPEETGCMFAQFSRKHGRI